MASIFTYEPDPPRVASPWPHDGNRDDLSDPTVARDGARIPRIATSETSQKVTRLQAEPQDGPVEYKLHLLLRPRRKFMSTSTGRRVSGSRHSKFRSNHSNRRSTESGVDPESGPDATPSSIASTQQTRQHRLEQLTTQLLWRLQQSSPHHTSSATNTILPSLPEALPELQAPREPAKLLHGLEESRGALYEIGVSDDGALVGLAEDEMRESLNNLRAMAACLGCAVEVLREVTVGDCEWLEDVVVGRKQRKVHHMGRLIVVEALVKPLLETKGIDGAPENEINNETLDMKHPRRSSISPPGTEQLRVTLIGPTASGKSTLLGTLTTSTLDNGRGKSRLSMLKHRHEISSGMTSSVTQELLGYQEVGDGQVEVINFATENVAAWTDIHFAAGGSRLVLISDSAGHPRYRRTTIRGLVGCAPHWTLLCVPADDSNGTAGPKGGSLAVEQNLGTSVSDVDISESQLELCLRLQLPLVILITKLDVASRSGLKSRLAKVLDALKSAGRKPAILTNSPAGEFDSELNTVEVSAIEGAYHVILPLLNDPTGSVPIVLTSAVHGTGVSNLHALLHELPIPDNFLNPTLGTGFEFHIEGVYSKPTEGEALVVSGLLRSGQISVGDTGVIGPFSIHELEDSEDSDERSIHQPPSHLPTSRSFPGALRNAHLVPHRLQLPNQEWRRVKVISVRNLRLPVHSLFTDQVGTVAIVLNGIGDTTPSVATFGRIRKGMVLTAIQPRAARSVTAEFKREDLASFAVGNHVVVYIASVRASAKVMSARAPDSPCTSKDDRHSNGHDPYDFEEIRVSVGDMEFENQDERVAGEVTAPNLLVTFTFDASKEFVVLGERILVMPGGGPGLYGGHGRGEKGLAGLEGFVGKITETFD